MKLSENALDTVSRGPSDSFLPSPVLLNHIQTNIVSKNIGMGNGIIEGDGRGMMGIALRENHLNMEDTSFI